MTSLQLLEIGRFDIACRVLLTPNFEIGSKNAKAVIELSRVGRRVVCNYGEGNAPSILRVVNVIEVEIIFCRGLLNGIIEEVEHDIGFHVSIQHDYENHAETHDHAAVCLQLWLSIFEQNFDILKEDIGLLDTFTKALFLFSFAAHLINCNYLTAI